MPELTFAAFAGSSLGLLHGIILWTSLESLGMASSFLTRNKYTLPFEVTAIVDISALLIVLTSGIWLPRMMKLQERHVKGLK